MPEPKNRYTFNAIVSYPFSNNLAKHLCGKVSANVVTILNIGISIAILYKILYSPCDYVIIFVLCAIRAFFDILDGSIARVCGEVSAVGHKLDKASDAIFEAMFVALLLVNVNRYKIYKKSYFIPVLAISLCMGMMWVLESVNRRPCMWQDNDLLFKPIIYTSFSYLAANCAIGP